MRKIPPKKTIYRPRDEYDCAMASTDTSLLASRVSRAEALARQLEAEIMGDALEPGHRIGTKEDLRRRFGVAVATVNEAVRLLEARGLIDARPGPGGGVFVASVSGRMRLSQIVLGLRRGTTTLADCVVVRGALEPLVCREAARYRRDIDIRALKRLLTQMSRHLDDRREYLRLTANLHRRIAKVCHNATLQSIYMTLLDYLDEGVDRVGLERFDAATSLEIHRELVSAISAGEGQQLEAAIRRHTPNPGQPS